MKSFKNILVVADGDSARTRQLLTPAIELAAPTSGVVTLLDLRPRSMWLGNSTPRRSSSALLSAPLHRLYDPGPNLRNLGVPVHHEFSSGVPHLEVLERIAVYGHDLVIMNGEPFGGRTANFRSTTARVLRSSSIPVWIHPETVLTEGPIAVAIGPKTGDDPADHLSKKLVTIGASLARSQQRDLHLIHAWRLDGETMMRSRRLGYEPADIERMGRDVQFEARMRAEELLADVTDADINIRIHVSKGHAVDVIASQSDTLEPAALVMGTFARQGIQGLVVGNTVDRVARRTQSPILAVKPDGLASPRTLLEDWTPQALPY